MYERRSASDAEPLSARAGDLKRSPENLPPSLTQPVTRASNSSDVHLPLPVISLRTLIDRETRRRCVPLLFPLLPLLPPSIGEGSRRRESDAEIGCTCSSRRGGSQEQKSARVDGRMQERLLYAQPEKREKVRKVGETAEHDYLLFRCDCCCCCSTAAIVTRASMP